MKSKTRSRVIIFSALAILSTLVIVLAILCLISGYFSSVIGYAIYHLKIEPQIDRQLNSIPFDEGLWRAQGRIDREDRDRTRKYMLDDLLNRYDFTGWSKSEVLKLLGHPDREYTNADTNAISIYYYLDGWTTDYFYLTFDEDDLVIRYAEGME